MAEVTVTFESYVSFSAQSSQFGNTEEIFAINTIIPTYKSPMSRNRDLTNLRTRFKFKRPPWGCLVETLHSRTIKRVTWPRSTHDKWCGTIIPTVNPSHLSQTWSQEAVAGLTCLDRQMKNVRKNFGFLTFEFIR